MVYQCGGSRFAIFRTMVCEEKEKNYTFDELRGLKPAERLRKRKAVVLDDCTGCCKTHCPPVCKKCSFHCPSSDPTTEPTPAPVPVPLPVPVPIPNADEAPPGVPGQKSVRVKLPSAYLGDNLVISAVDLGNGYYQMIGNTFQVNGKTLVIKVIDAQQVNFNYNMQYPSQMVALMQPRILNLGELEKQRALLSGLRAKPVLTEQEKESMKRALVYLQFVDIMWLNEKYMQWLAKKTGFANVNKNLNFLASFANIPDLDNAFFAQYMVYGSGQSLFYPMGAIDIAGHELSHGFVSQLNGLIYQGHAGALNEHIADACALFFEHDMYEKYNTDVDLSNDLRGKWDFTMGEDNGRQFKILRNFENPEECQQPQPKTYRGKFWANPNSPQDYGGVHANSGPANYLVYLLVTSIGWEAAWVLLLKAWAKLGTKGSYILYRDLLKSAGQEMGVGPKVQECLNGCGLTDAAVSDWTPQ